MLRIRISILFVKLLPLIQLQSTLVCSIYLGYDRDLLVGKSTEDNDLEEDVSCICSLIARHFIAMDFLGGILGLWLPGSILLYTIHQYQYIP